MASRIPDLPVVIDDTRVKDFLTHYYNVSNDPNTHDEYTDLFTDDGEFSMNAKKAKGKEEILALRKAIWAHVPNRDHTPTQIYTHGHDQMDLMVHGEVSYVHHAGHESATEWAASVNLIEVDGKIKLKRYHIIVDSAAHV